MRRRGRGAKKGFEAGSRGAYSICCRDIRLLPNRAARGGEVAGRDGSPVGGIKNPARPVGTEGLNRIGGSSHKDASSGGGHVYGCDAKRRSGGHMATGLVGPGRGKTDAGG